ADLAVRCSIGSVRCLRGAIRAGHVGPASIDPVRAEPRHRIRDRTCDDPDPHICNWRCAVKRPVSTIVVAAVIGLTACNGSNGAAETTPPPGDPSSTTELDSVTRPSVDQATTTTSAAPDTTTASTVEST